MTSFSHPSGWLSAMGVAAGVLALVVARGSAAQDSPQDHATWWIESFGALEAPEQPLVERARVVFARVAAAADKKTTRPPRLLVVREKPGPFAAALPDGTVVLTRAGLDLCYGQVALPLGDARLAFVLGHEVAHLAKHDTWYAFATAAMQHSSEAAQVRRSVTLILREGPEEQRRKELEADSFGLLYMAMAGYPSNAVLGAGSSFLDDWAVQVRGPGETTGRSHPSPRERTALLRAQLQSVAEEIELFEIGARLYQVGRFDDAVLFLERFRERFPSREVFNNLGLAHYQLAQRALAGCGPEVVLRFRLPTLLDPETLAQGIRRGPSDPCPGLRTEASEPDSPFARHVAEAIRQLQQALDLDQSYLPARINLASTLLLDGREPARALHVAEQTLALAPESAEALNARALALYLYGAHGSFEEMKVLALEKLAELRRRYPEDAISAYNRAAVLAERDRAAGHAAWHEFLGLEDAGLFAEMARRRLEGDDLARPQPARGAAGPPVSSPVPLGPMGPTADKRLGGMRRRGFDIGGLTGALHRGGALRVLEIEFAVELVEEDLMEPRPASEVTDVHGPPLRDHPARDGRTLVYRKMAFDVADGRVVRRIFFR